MQIDRLIQLHFGSAELFGESMKQLHRYLEVKSKPFSAYEELDFQDGDGDLDYGDYEEWCLDKARAFFEDVEREFQTSKAEALKVLESSLEPIFRNISAIATSVPAAHSDSQSKSQSPETANTTTQDAIIEALHGQFQELVTQINPAIPESENPTISECINLWISDDRGEEQKRALRLFCQYLTESYSSEIRTADLTPEHIRAYHRFYENLPRHIVTKGLSIEEILIEAKRRATASGTLEMRSSKTISDHYGHIATFFTWCINQGYQLQNNVPHVLKHGSNAQKSASKEKATRVIFTDDDLTRFFNSTDYTTPNNFKWAAMYWAPLIALFTGARSSEIISLETHNIKEEQGIWCLEFLEFDSQSSDPDKRLKTKGSERVVPIHPQLIDLGWLEYVHRMESRLFPDELRNSLGKFDAFQKRQANYRKKIGLTTQGNTKKDFHSFRHHIRTLLFERRYDGPSNTHYDTGLIVAVVGHASEKRSMGDTVYTHSQQIELKHKAIMKLHYPSIDFKKIVSWRNMRFGRDILRGKAP